MMFQWQQMIIQLIEAEWRIYASVNLPSLVPGRHQTIIRTNDVILLSGPLGTSFSELSIGIQTLYDAQHGY